jgi:DNA polymerase-3 subunit gamma/tau
MKELLSSLLLSETKNLTRVFRGLLDENVDLKKLCDQILDNLYRIINSIDEEKTLYDEGILSAGALKGVSIAELFWIYETFAKDLTWALSSINPEKVVLIMLQKVALRRSILTGEDIKIEEIPQSAGKPEAGVAQPMEMAKPNGLDKTWGSFLNYLRQTSPATAANLEHGNLLEEVNVRAVPLVITVAFPEESAVFQEFLDEKEIYARLKNHLADFFEVDIEKIQFKSQLLTSEEKKDKNFRTKVEIDDEARMSKEEARRQRILNDPFVKEAEKLFNAKIDKIVLKDQEN